MIRKIIEIDRDKCDGCGLCTEACAEGALELDEENKAVLVREIYCDGMGACLDVCPTGALRIIEKESEAYDPKATYHHILNTRGKEAALHVHGAVKKDESDERAKEQGIPLHNTGCPGSMAREIHKPSEKGNTRTAAASSELSQWPIQLRLVSPYAPYFEKSHLLVAADCTAFALGSFHEDLLKGKKLIIACPKLDDTAGYIEKLAELLKNNTIRSLTVATMVVPCCRGLVHIVEKAVELSEIDIGIKKIIIGIDGKMHTEENLQEHSQEAHPISR